MNAGSGDKVKLRDGTIATVLRGVGGGDVIVDVGGGKQLAVASDAYEIVTPPAAPAEAAAPDAPAAPEGGEGEPGGGS